MLKEGQGRLNRILGGEVRERKVVECERKYAGRGTWSEHAQQDFGKGSTGN